MLDEKDSHKSTISFLAILKEAGKRLNTLGALLKCEVRPTDVSDDRLASVAEHLSQNSLWKSYERRVTQQLHRQCWSVRLTIQPIPLIFASLLALSIPSPFTDNQRLGHPNSATLSCGHIERPLTSDVALIPIPPRGTWSMVTRHQ